MIERGLWPSLLHGLLRRNRRSPGYHRVMAYLCLAFCAVDGRPGAADEIRYFVDERGVPHFSNVPADRRYRYVLPSTAAPRSDPRAGPPEAVPGLNETAGPPAVSIFAPPIVKRG